MSLVKPIFILTFPFSNVIFSTFPALIPFIETSAPIERPGASLKYA